MRSTPTAIASAVAGILLLDSVGSFASHSLGWGYVPVGLAAYAFYLVGGTIAGAKLGIGPAALVGAAMAAAHATVGWWLAALLGPPSVAEAFEAADWIGRVVNVGFSSILGAGLGSLGGLVGRRFGSSAGP